MTPSKTPFAGYERLAPGDSLSSDGYSFQFQNPAIADRLGKLGAVTHRHDAHAAMLDPTLAPTVTTAASGGSIPSGTSIHVAYTLTDPEGGETLPRAPIVVTTSGGYADPASAPSASVSTSAGSLLAGTYLYAATVTDGAGGETALGPAVTVLVNPGSAHAEANVSGLTAITNASSGSLTSAGWRLWRSVDGGASWQLMATGAYSVDTHTDDGSSGGDCTVSPPSSGTTVGTNKLTVTVPGGQPASATFFSIYASLDGQFLAPCLLGTYPIADVTVPIVYTALALLNGQPPAVSSCYPGADQIDPDTDILGWTWKLPVADAAALPALGNTAGDARVTLDTLTIHVWTGSAWTIPPGGVPSGAAGGDLSGVYPNPTVAQLNGIAAASYAQLTATQTLTNKRITRRVLTVTQSATPAINTNNADVASITALAQAITSMTTNLTGTPVDGDELLIRITDDGTGRAITWGAKFEASTVALPTTTVASALLAARFIWNAATSKWRCILAA